MRREGTPAWMQVVERRLEQAAEDARSRPAQAGIQWFKPAIPPPATGGRGDDNQSGPHAMPSGRPKASRLFSPVPHGRTSLQPPFRHLIEQPMLGLCRAGPLPVSATCRMASTSSRRVAGSRGSLPLESSRPRYCNSNCAL